MCQVGCDVVLFSQQSQVSSYQLDRQSFSLKRHDEIYKIALNILR